MPHDIFFISFFEKVSNFFNIILTNQKLELVIRNCQGNCMQVTSEKIYTCLILGRGVINDRNTVVTILSNWISTLDHVFHTDAFYTFSRIGMYSRLITFSILMLFAPSGKLLDFGYSCLKHKIYFLKEWIIFTWQLFPDELFIFLGY